MYTRSLSDLLYYLSEVKLTQITDKEKMHDRVESAADGDDIHSLTEQEIFDYHHDGKLDVSLKAPLDNQRALSVAYTPGVAIACKKIYDEPETVRDYTWAGRLVAVVSDGTAVLGLGNIGPEAALPVMEGKCALFKEFAGLNAIPIVLDTTDIDEIVETCIRLRPSLGAINLEDISAPRCFEVEDRLVEALDIPVMHDDQHGTAVVVLAGITNACRLTGRKLEDLKVVISGAGAAGVAITKIIMNAGIKDVVVLDSRGIVSKGRDNLNPVKEELADITNPDNLTGGQAEALEGADLFIGVSAGHVPEEIVRTMADDAFIFSLSNPDPEIPVDIAKRHAAIVATGRSDYPNQLNNVLAFPGIFKGALDANAKGITDEMLLAAADAIAGVIDLDELTPEYIVPSPLDPRVCPAVSAAVKAAALGDQ